MTSKKLAINELLADPGFSLGEGNVTINELASANGVIKNLMCCLTKLKRMVVNSAFV